LAKGIYPMYKPGSFHILLVHPPAKSPAAPPLALAKAVGLLAGSGLSLEPYDANLEFFLNHALTPQRLTRFVDLIKKRGKRAIVNDGNPFFISLFKNLTTHSEKWAQKIADVKQSLELLRTEDFYCPESCLTTLKDIGDLLDLVSLAYYPSRIQWGHFSNSDVQNVSQARSFVDDDTANPFLSFCKDTLTSRITGTQPGLVILFVSVPDQVLAALTIARFVKTEYPKLHVALIGKHELLAGTEGYCDSTLLENDQQALFDLITSLAKPTIEGDLKDPDFSGLPLKDYLAPAVVLPFEELSGVKENETPPSRLMTLLVKQAKRCGAQGFLSTDRHLTPSYIAKMAGERVKEHPFFCIGLTCTLESSIGTEKIVQAYEAGARFIQWQNPKDELKSLNKLLWDVSRTGIWNHVVIAAEQDDNLSQGLIDFMEANPNIVHSWIQQQQSISSSPTAQTEKSSTAYMQVVEMPGEPLWRRLNEPVYQLLYLNRYGVTKVMRWRVRGDGCSVYSLGQNITYHFVAPQELPPGYLDEICRMVEAGGSVEKKWVRYNLERAFLIGYVLEEGIIVGNSSLKHPRAEYVEAVNKQSGLDLTDYLERGYTSVRPEYRGMGIGTTLLEGLTARVGKKKVYSIISADNVATQKIALRNKTKQVATFYSERLGKEIGVWIPAWMVEK